MDYQFTLSTANMVANLTFGRVRECFWEIMSYDECYYGFLHFLKYGVVNFFTEDNQDRMNVFHDVYEAFLKLEVQERNFKLISIEEVLGFSIYKEAYHALADLAGVLSRCKVKSILLSPLANGYSKEKDRFMTSERIRSKLFDMFPGDSCLILQPQDSPRSAMAYNAFPNFDVALRQADLWPAVLFWEDSDNYVFIPVKNEDQLMFLYNFIRHDKYSIKGLKKWKEKDLSCDEIEYMEWITEVIEPSYYIFQISDLHLGAKDVEIAERRLRSMLNLQFSKIAPKDSTSVIITGDAVDSPKRKTDLAYRNFAEQLRDRTGCMPIRILGNHDVHPHGLSLIFGRLRQLVADSVGQYPQIQILEDVKVILLLFNSNTRGKWAEGEIGKKQMAEMGNQLDAVENLTKYTLVAVLHHHLVKIQKPDDYDKRWFEKILPDDFMEMTLKLLDADLFLEWLRLRHVKIVLHGHKHIPYLTEKDGITIIGCGSSTGQVVSKVKGKTCISYNMLKIGRDSVTCTQFVEKVWGAGPDIRTDVIKLHE